MIKNKGINITFDAEAIEFILETFEKKVDDEGFIVEKNDPKQRVVSRNGEPVHIKEFAGIRNGSEIFIKKDLPSLIQYTELEANEEVGEHS